MTELPLLEDSRHRIRIAPELGGGIASFEAVTGGGLVPILRPWAGVERGPFGLGCNLLLPFSNRISGGGFSYGGVFHPVAPNLEGEALPLHGDGFQKPWVVEIASAQSVTLGLPKGEIGPYRYQARIRYALTGDGLSCRLAMTSMSDHPLPFGGGFHPWFPRHADTILCFSADRVWTEDENHLPQQHVDLSDIPGWDFARPSRLPAKWINNAFTGWDGRATIAQPGLGVEILLKAEKPLDTAIAYSPDDGASFFCFEPVSHAVDAVNLDGRPGLVDLGKGETLALEMTLSWAPLVGA